MEEQFEEFEVEGDFQDVNYEEDEVAEVVELLYFIVLTWVYLSGRIVAYATNFCIGRIMQYIN